eukprot:1161842-Pelagomonas_calceolata.AAC.3
MVIVLSSNGDWCCLKVNALQVDVKSRAVSLFRQECLTAPIMSVRKSQTAGTVQECSNEGKEGDSISGGSTFLVLSQTGIEGVCHGPERQLKCGRQSAWIPLLQVPRSWAPIKVWKHSYRCPRCLYNRTLCEHDVFVDAPCAESMGLSSAPPATGAGGPGNVYGTVVKAEDDGLARGLNNEVGVKDEEGGKFEAGAEEEGSKKRRKKGGKGKGKGRGSKK